ncbi:hypothetical protein GQ44DRAFT_310916 [Phaeosphaeriaceae sp. PMI808]|nr:hypothetical protein GQ44DRAFT_310916 [Phaeosphaeriaceae sp. PMI808]
MENWEGFIAVETEEPGLWSLCFDRYDDGLKGKTGEDIRTVELEPIRVQLTSRWDGVCNEYLAINYLV